MATPNESSTLPNLLSIEEEEVENNSDTESVVKWDSLIYEEISTLHWCSDDQITEGVLRFRVLCLPHIVYPSVARIALFSVDESMPNFTVVGIGVNCVEIFTRLRWFWVGL